MFKDIFNLLSNNSSIESVFKEDNVNQIIDKINLSGINWLNKISLSNNSDIPILLNNDNNKLIISHHLDCLVDGSIDEDCFYIVYNGNIESSSDLTFLSNTRSLELRENENVFINKDFNFIDISSGTPKIHSDNDKFNFIYYDYSANTFKFVSKSDLSFCIYSNGFDDEDEDGDGIEDISELIRDLENNGNYIFSYDIHIGSLYYYKYYDFSNYKVTNFYIDVKYKK